MVSSDVFERLHAAAQAACLGHGPAHDFSHVERVVALARTLAESEGASVEVVTLSALLHELFNYPKDHPESHRSGDVCAFEATTLMEAEGVHPSLVFAVATCIRDHAFSKGATPPTLEAAVLQDADRLDAIGAVGVMRWAATCDEMQRPFYATNDPFCRARPDDDKTWGLDHFYRKLLRIPEGLHTDAARNLAAPRVEFMRSFLSALEREIQGAAKII